MVKYIANAFRQKTNIGSLPPYEKVKGYKKKLSVPVDCFQTVGNNKN